MALRHNGHRGARRTAAVTLALLAVPTVLALVLAHHYKFGVANELATALVSGGLAAVYLAWVMVRMTQGDAVSGQSIGQSIGEIADELSKAVRRRTKAMVAWSGLNDPLPLRVSWTDAEERLVDSWDLRTRLASEGGGWSRHRAASRRLGWPRAQPTLAGSGRDLVRILARVPAGRLVVLGVPGAGKTTLMARLILDLLAERSGGNPVPVLIRAATWNPTKDELHKWLKAQLILDYPGLGAPAPRESTAGTRAGALLDAGLILPILDGLDEIPVAIRGSAIAAINEAFTAGEPFLVTCRTDDYRDAVLPPAGTGTPTRLRGAAGVELRPVKAADVADYLRALASCADEKDRWKSVITALGAVTPLAEVLSTPLMVGLAWRIYNRNPEEPGQALPDPANLCAFTRQEEIEHHLLSTSIRGAYPSSPRSGRHRLSWSADQAEGWLTFLAANADGVPRSFEIAWWQLSGALPRMAGGLIVGGSSALLFGLAGWFAGGREYGAAYALAYGLAFGLAGGLSYGFRSSEPRRVRVRFRGTLIMIIRRCAIGSVMGLLFALVVGQPAVLPAGAAIGLVFGCHGWMNTPTPVDQVASASDSLRQDRAGTLLSGLMAALALGITGALDVDANFGPGGPGIVGSLTGTLAGILICGIIAAFLGKLEYGQIGMFCYGIAGGVLGLLASAWSPPVTGLGPGLGYGVTFGLGAAVAIIAPRAWGSFQIARIVLALRRRQPWRIMTFLADAHERGILRQAGGGYQFRHARLREHLALRAALPREPPVRYGEPKATGPEPPAVLEPHR